MTGVEVVERIGGETDAAGDRIARPGDANPASAGDFAEVWFAIDGCAGDLEGGAIAAGENEF